VGGEDRRFLSGVSPSTPGVYTRCTATCESGARVGPGAMTKTRQQSTREAHPSAVNAPDGVIASYGAAVGTTTRTLLPLGGRPIGSRIQPASTSASVSPATFETCPGLGASWQTGGRRCGAGWSDATLTRPTPTTRTVSRPGNAPERPGRASSGCKPPPPGGWHALRADAGGPGPRRRVAGRCRDRARRRGGGGSVCRARRIAPGRCARIARSRG
jgi:hypothetical protein